jgi:hypothetical protein
MDASPGSPASPRGPTARSATSADEAALRAAFGDELPDAVERAETVLLATLPDGRILAGAVVRALHSETEPPGIGCVYAATGLEAELTRAGVRVLLRAGETVLREHGAPEWVVTLEATAHASIRAAEDLGYRPTGRPPYRVLGPGVVEYLHGYTGPEGYFVDFAPDR